MPTTDDPDAGAASTMTDGRNARLAVCPPWFSSSCPSPDPVQPTSEAITGDGESGLSTPPVQNTDLELQPKLALDSMSRQRRGPTPTDIAPVPQRMTDGQRTSDGARGQACRQTDGACSLTYKCFLSVAGFVGDFDLMTSPPPARRMSYALSPFSNLSVTYAKLVQFLHWSR
jgi:hypothetical protein